MCNDWRWESKEEAENEKQAWKLWTPPFEPKHREFRTFKHLQRPLGPHFGKLGDYAERKDSQAWRVLTKKSRECNKARGILLRRGKGLICLLRKVGIFTQVANLITVSSIDPKRHCPSKVKTSSAVQPFSHRALHNCTDRRPMPDSKLEAFSEPS